MHIRSKRIDEHLQSLILFVAANYFLLHQSHALGLLYLETVHKANPRTRDL